uniref:Uncharacterized protein n=1 Tax=Picea glauca TaxID=3330 RepID=A0A117NGH8_PICGL|nr:hypothetical protein ABT39_MTgene6258 [Picea glauca]
MKPKFTFCWIPGKYLQLGLLALQTLLSFLVYLCVRVHKGLCKRLVGWLLFLE